MFFLGSTKEFHLGMKLHLLGSNSKARLLTLWSRPCTSCQSTRNCTMRPEAPQTQTLSQAAQWVEISQKNMLATPSNWQFWTLTIFQTNVATSGTLSGIYIAPKKQKCKVLKETLWWIKKIERMDQALQRSFSFWPVEHWGRLGSWRTARAKRTSRRIRTSAPRRRSHHASTSLTKSSSKFHFPLSLGPAGSVSLDHFFEETATFLWTPGR